MKHLKLYEKNYNENSLESFFEEKQSFYDKIKDFLLFEEHDITDQDIIIDMYFYKDDDIEKCIIVRAMYQDDNNKYHYHEDSIVIENNELPNLYRFMENPETYKSSKKYNL